MRDYIKLKIKHNVHLLPNIVKLWRTDIKLLINLLFLALNYICNLQYVCIICTHWYAIRRQERTRVFWGTSSGE